MPRTSWLTLEKKTERILIKCTPATRARFYEFLKETRAASLEDGLIILLNLWIEHRPVRVDKL